MYTHHTLDNYIPMCKLTTMRSKRLPQEHTNEETGLQDPNDFLDRHHPENDDYMQAIAHVQRQIMHQSALLRHKQVQILKTLFTGSSYAAAAEKHNTSPSTVSKLAKSENGQRLLNLLQYHLHLLEGPNAAQRRNMLWRIAQDNEQVDPKVSISSLAELNKMHHQEKALAQKLQETKAPQTVININQELLPRGALD